LERNKLKQLREERAMKEFEAEIATASCSNPVTVQQLHSSFDNDMSAYNIISDMPESFTNYNVSTSDKSFQTPFHLTKNTPQYIKLINEIRIKNQEIKQFKKKYKYLTKELTEVNTVKQMLKLSKEYLPPSLNLIINAYINSKNKIATGNRYCKEFKQFALNIYLLGPKVYTFLQSTLALPNPCTLKRISKCEPNPDLNNCLPIKTLNCLSESIE